MHQLRSALAIVGTVVAFAVSLVMLARVIGAGSPWLALLLMFYFLGVAKIAEPLLVLHLPAPVRRVRHWETAGTLYKRLGVFVFGRALRNSPFRYLNAAVYLAPHRPDLHRLYRHAASSEATHFWAALLFTPYIGYLFLTARPGMAMLFLIAQVLVNIYPILHLRALRGRLDATLRREA